MAASQNWSPTWTYIDGEWHEGNVPLWGARTHAIWLGSSVFDGARVFEDVAPDLDLHCARVNASAQTMFLKPAVSVDEMVGLTREGMAKFEPGTTLYVRPMYWAERAGPMALPPDPDSTRFALTLYDAPMRKPEGFSVTLSPFRRPTRDTAPSLPRKTLELANSATLPTASHTSALSKPRDFASNIARALFG